MLNPSLAWLLLTLVCSSLGIVGIVWCRRGHDPRRALWGRRFLVGTLLALGLIGLSAAFDPHSAVQFFGLAVALLVIGMIWEGPRAAEPTVMVEEL